MRKTRIVLAKMPPIMHEILKDLVNRQPDMEVVAEVGTLAGLPEAIESHGAEAVIVTLYPKEAPEAVCSLQTRYPRIMVLSFADDRHGPVVWPCRGAPQAVAADGSAVVDALRQRARDSVPANSIH
jgi:DNA-binding NarL/FixJ family response regulator